jgi:transposase InsO family protein
VKRLCSILGIARSSYCCWCRTAAAWASRRAAVAGLAARVRVLHRESDGTCGVARITAELRDGGERVNCRRIARVVRSIGLADMRLRRRHCTTVADPPRAKAPDPIGRGFTVTEPNTMYVGDFTDLPLENGKLHHPATVVDLASRRLVDPAIAAHMCTDLVTDALAAAERSRGSLAGAVIHTGRGAHGGFNCAGRRLGARSQSARHHLFEGDDEHSSWR